MHIVGTKYMQGKRQISDLNPRKNKDYSDNTHRPQRFRNEMDFSMKSNLEYINYYCIFNKLVLYFSFMSKLVTLGISLENVHIYLQFMLFM